MLGPPAAPARRRRGRGGRGRWLPQRRWARALAVLVPLLVAVAGIALTASAAPGPTPAPVAAAAPLAPAQPPVLPLPPNPSCVPGSAEPACLLPETSSPRPAPPTGLPSTPLVPGPSAPPVSCFPGSVLPECGNLPTQPPTSQPCDGPNCIPQPVPRDPGDDDSECGFTDPVACVTEAIDTFFRGLVIGALNPLLDLLGKTVLSTPDPSLLPGIGQAWTESWHLMLAFYGSIVVIAGLILMAYETLQTRYTIKEIAPRLAAGFLAGTLSLFLATQGIEISNAVSATLMTDAVNPNTAAKAMTDMILGSLNGGQGWLLFIGLALAALLVVLLLTFIVRVLATMLLIAAAPFVLMWHALPHTEGVAVFWWKAYGLLLIIPIGQAGALSAALRVFFTPGGFTISGPTLNGVTNLLFCVALMWILVKIPFWCLQPLRGGGGRSLLGSLVRGAIAYKTMGLLGGATSLFGRKGRKPGPAHRARGRDTAPADPPSTRSGQFMLPIRVRRTRPAPGRSPRLGEMTDTGAGAGRKPGPGQLSLFTTSGSGDGQTVSANPRALPPDSLPGALPRDQLGLPITTRRNPDRVGRRSLADDLAARGAGIPPPVPQPGLLTSDGRVNRNARPPAHLPRALIAPSAGMLPIHLRPAPPATPRRSLADDLTNPAPASPPRQTGPGLITPSGQINRAARASRRPARDAYTGNRPLASGQYPLPLDVRRQPPPPPPASGASAAPPPKRRTGTQLRLPLDLPARRGPKTK
ncbi:hypothetical protein NQK81_27925 [Amycolatopsis roodepoortensis]|uniref:hypothetical protein n=1 Tax=Amycolatopsis roodepoortensis TaxID=700274 RepID=UPI00214C0F82|nr:hypothetical protein [Amycolatopsis roodepoortensis]UUV28606.1 hypothetical protein NQK81_27925 [Amycolatopsis roodepoortensis]